jgi:hypothetical protein
MVHGRSFATEGTNYCRQKNSSVPRSSAVNKRWGSSTVASQVIRHERLGIARVLKRPMNGPWRKRSSDEAGAARLMYHGATSFFVIARSDGSTGEGWVGLGLRAVPWFAWG